jgi:hypothetical protein
MVVHNPIDAKIYSIIIDLMADAINTQFISADDLDSKVTKATIEIRDIFYRLKAAGLF